MKPDKVKHYKVGYAFGRYGSIVGFLLIAVILAPAKELYDAIVPEHYSEWKDYTASVRGAWDGMLFRKSKV